MVVKDFFVEVFEKILFMNVDIRIIVQLIKTNEINVDIVDGSKNLVGSFPLRLIFDFLQYRKCIRMGMKKEGL